MNEYRVYVRGYFRCIAENENDAMNTICGNIPDHHFCYVIDKFTCNGEIIP